MEISEVVSEPEIRGQLALMLRSHLFIKRKEQARLLKFLVERTLAGAPPTEWEIGTQVFDLPENWIEDPNVSIVRVNIFRLKKSLQEYSSGRGNRDPVVLRLSERTIAAEYRRKPKLIRSDPLVMIERPLHDALNWYFTLPGEPSPRCVVTGEPNDLQWHHLDGDPLNLALANLIPLSGKLRAHLLSLQAGKTKSLLADLAPKRLAEDIAPKHFKEWKFARAYGCAALAFHLGRPPFAEESSDLRVLRLCDVIHYMRHHFFEPLIFSVIDGVLRPFTRRLDSIDPICAIRLAIQITALLEESCFYPEAEKALSLATRLSLDGRARSGDARLDAFKLARRRSQLAAETAPFDESYFRKNIEQAQENVNDAEDRLVTLSVVRVHRWLRQGTPQSIEHAQEALIPLLASYTPSVFTDKGIVKPSGLSTADLSELFLLAGIASSRLQPGGWKHRAEELVARGKILMHEGSHVLPTEYGRFVQTPMRKNAVTARRILNLSPSQLRRALRDDTKTTLAGIVECLERLRLLERKRAPWRN